MHAMIKEPGSYYTLQEVEEVGGVLTQSWGREVQASRPMGWGSGRSSALSNDQDQPQETLRLLRMGGKPGAVWWGNSQDSPKGRASCSQEAESEGQEVDLCLTPSHQPCLLPAVHSGIAVGA